MSETTPPPPADAQSPGVVSAVLGLLFEPGATFAAILKRPSVWVPLALYLAVQASFTGFWLQKVEPQTFVRQQMEEFGTWERIPEERRGEVLAGAAQGLKRNAWLGALGFGPIFLLALAGIYLFIFRFFYGAEVDYRRSLTIVVWCFAVFVLVTVPLTLGVLALKGDWNLNPQDVLQANPTLLLERSEVAKPLWAVLTSLDLTSFWLLFLTASGFAAAARKTAGWAAAGVLTPWAFYVLIKVGFAFLF